MLQLILKSYLGFLMIPLLTLALEPTNPTVYCDRFLGDQEKAQCEQKASAPDLDWYASSTCSLQQEDKNFLHCLDEIKGATFSPEALELCGKSLDISDEARLNCVQKIKNKNYSRVQIKKCAEAGATTAIEKCLSSANRSPASTKNSTPGFQSLEVPK